MTMESVFSHAAAFLPVLLFLMALWMLDSYKLVDRSRIVYAILAGALAALASYLVNTAAFQAYPEQALHYSHFGAPVVEELLKGAYWIFLITTIRAAFMVDAGICGFAVGAGFSLVENFFYLHGLEVTGIGVSIVRGFGTALMHGTVAAVAAMISIYMNERFEWKTPWQFIPGLLLAIAIHSSFNWGLLSPIATTVVSTVTILVSMPLLLFGVFFWSEASMRRWLGNKLDKDLEVLNMIATGEFQDSRAGAYLRSLQDKFPDEIRADMLCMMQLTIELSARAKGDLLSREAGIELPPDPDLDAQFEELAYLQKSIGRTGLLAVAPLLSQTPRDLWEMRRLAQGR
jgi:protease PrsW